MREYGQVQCAFWQSADATAWSDQAKLLALYLKTGPHSNGIGAYVLPEGYVMADLGWSLDTVRERYTELHAVGYAYRFGTVIFLPTYLRWNVFANWQVATARFREWQALPKGEGKAHAANALLTFGAHLKDGQISELETVRRTVSEPYAYRTQPNPTQPDPKSPSAGEGLPTERKAGVAA